MKKKLNITELELPLKELVEREGVNAAAVVSKSGVLVGFANKHKTEELPPLSPVVAMMARTTEKCTKLLKMGDVVEIGVKTDSGMVVTEKSGEFIFLVAVDKGIDIDAIKLQREQVMDVIRSLL